MTKGQWEILSPNTLLIEADSKAYLLNSAFVDETFLALQMDGTNEVMVLVEEELRQKLQLENIEQVNKFLYDTEKEYKVKKNYSIYPDEKPISVKTKIKDVFIVIFILVLLAVLANLSWK